MAAHKPNGKGFEPQLTATQLRAWVAFLEERILRLETVTDAAKMFVHADARQTLVAKRELWRVVAAMEEAERERVLPMPTPAQQSEAAAWAIDL